MTEPTAPARQRMPLHWKIAIGFVAGLVLGLFVFFNDAAATETYTLEAVGTDALTDCTLTLSNANTRTVTAACGFTSW